MVKNKFIESIHNILRISKKDLRAALGNPIVTLTLIGIIILPSLYANLNIMACWDLYSNTDNIKIAVVNNDQPITFDNKTLNIGNDVIKELNKNHDFNWTIVNESDARKGVESGKYYSAMIIPSNFSSNIASINSDKPQAAILEYLVNIKTNPVASRMTDSASKEVQREISNNIVKILDIMAVEKLSILKTSLATGATKLNNGASKVSNGVSTVSSGANKLGDGANKLTKGSEKLTKGSKELSSGANKLSTGSEKINKASNTIKQKSNEASSNANKVAESARQIKKYADNAHVSDPIAQGIINSSSNVAESSAEVAGGVVKLSNATSNIADGSNELAKSSKELAKGSNKLANSSEELAKGSNKIASSSVKLANGAVSLATGSDSLAKASSNALSTASNSLSNITNINRDYLGDYFYSPVILKKNELNPIKDYGSEVAPFYLTLSIWVGCIVTCVMLKMRFLKNNKYKPIEVYFGKMGLFLIMALLQTTVTMIWAYLIGIEISNMYLFIASMYIIALVFMFLIYSFMSVFGLIGKGASIVLLVLQILSTGGIYPVEVMPPLFKSINPFMPMTYAITMIREACLGLYLPNYLHAISILLIFPIVIFIIAVVIKSAGRLDKKANYVEEKLINSGLF